MAEFQFGGARAKTKAAASHFRRLDTILSEYLGSDPVELRVQEISGWNEIACHVRPLPVEASIEAGSVVYQLRSALDLMTSELARISGHDDTSGVYFPMAKSQSFFEDRRTQKKICKLSPDRRDRILALKPYADSDLLKLNALANTDRHNDLIRAIPNIEDFDFDISTAYTPPVGAETGEIHAQFRAPHPLETGRVPVLRVPLSTPVTDGKLKIELSLVLAPAIVRGESVLPTLRSIGLRINAILRDLEAAENA